MADGQKKQYAVFWHKENRAPIILDVFAREDIAYGDSISYMAVDIRPVFWEEKLLLSKILPDVFSDTWEKSVWADKSSHFFIDGVKVKKSILQALNQQGKTIILVTHAQEDSRKAQRIVTLSNGRIISDEKISTADI